MNGLRCLKTLQITNLARQFTKILIYKGKIENRVNDMGKRSKLELYFDVLESINKGTHKPTRIMYDTNLSWNTLNEVLGPLVDNEFLRKEVYNSSKKRYFITDKGVEALEYYEKSVEDLIQA
jgi:predicted transcriptional regulator